MKIFNASRAGEHIASIARTEEDRHHSIGVVTLDELGPAIQELYALGLVLHKIHPTCLDDRDSEPRACIVLKPSNYDENASHQVDSFHLLVDDITWEGSSKKVNAVLSKQNLEPINWKSNGLVYFKG